VPALTEPEVLVAAPRPLTCPVKLARSAFEAGCLCMLQQKGYAEQLALIAALNVLREETARRWRS
jgi:hypothetical protein